jgi:hypothetical protein
MDDNSARVSRTSPGLKHRNTLVPQGICFVYIQMRDDTTDKILAKTDYLVRGLLHGARIAGATDADGILRHEYLRGGHYELDASGVTEPVETCYMHEVQNYTGKPWVLRLRSEE